MSKTFRYIYITNEYYSDFQDSNICEGNEFDYTVDDDDLLREVVDLVYEEYFNVVGTNEAEVKARLKSFIDDNCLLDGVLEAYEDRLKEIFENEAMEWYGDD